MLPIVQTAAYLPYAAVLLFTILLYLLPPVGEGQTSFSALDAILAGLGYILSVAGSAAALVGIIAFREKAMALLLVATILFFGNLTGREGLLPVAEWLGATICCLTAAPILAYVAIIEVRRRRMFWSRWQQ